MIYCNNYNTRERVTACILLRPLAHGGGIYIVHQPWDQSRLWRQFSPSFHNDLTQSQHESGFRVFQEAFCFLMQAPAVS